jgi:hypothetical protein
VSHQFEGDDQSARLHLEGFDLLLDPRLVLAAAIEPVDGGLGEEQERDWLKVGKSGERAVPTSAGSVLTESNSRSRR